MSANPFAFRPLQFSDLEDDRRLERYIRGLEHTIMMQGRAIQAMSQARATQWTVSDLRLIKRALESGGAAELDLTNLTGVTAEPGDARIPRVDAHPDPVQTPYDTYVLVGTGSDPDTIWQIDRTVNPPAKVQIEQTATNVMTTDTDQTIGAGVTKTYQDVQIFNGNIEVNRAIMDSFDVNGGFTCGYFQLFSSALTPALVAANTTAEQTFAGVVPGAQVGYHVDVVKPTPQAGLGIVGKRISGAGNLAITFSNNTAAGITPTAGESYLIMVIG